jgi:hypothetical protein
MEPFMELSRTRVNLFEAEEEVVRDVGPSS